MLDRQDVELAVKGKFDAVLDTIGVSETERIGINFLKRGGHYMTLQGEAASLADRYGLAIGLPAATALLLNKQLLYRCTRGIAKRNGFFIERNVGETYEFICNSKYFKSCSLTAEGYEGHLSYSVGSG
ncbi:hypothetical protein LR48_Vigan05g113100 [Vigna angularis]|uniref:Uncharacterized protein n=1 Tax=Phaseolus angularis TaxID=3914 RepID=A0A0L9ULV5_PHAAN|nr:hypothetical protein LR48_Vigan05g113100 [Vigna angularis]